MKDDRIYLEHIQEAVEKIMAYSAGGRDEFMENSMIQDAVARNFEIVGEATKRLSPETLQKRPDLPWNDIARFRDVLIHHYMGVDLKRVWNVIESHLPALRKAVKEMLES